MYRSTWLYVLVTMTPYAKMNNAWLQCIQGSENIYDRQTRETGQCNRRHICGEYGKYGIFSNKNVGDIKIV